MSLIKLEQAKILLSEANTLEDIKKVVDLAEMAKEYYKRAGMADEAQRLASEISLRAKRKAGNITKDIPKKPGPIAKKDSPPDAEKLQTKGEVIKKAGLTTQEVSKNEQISNISEEEFEEYIENNKEITTTGVLKMAKAKEFEKRRNDVANIETKVDDSIFVDIYNTDNKYNIIYADPAWQYWESGEKNQSIHYKTMSIEEISSLPINNISSKDCILFMWVSFPILYEAKKVIESWGFTYSTCGFVWIKKNKKSDSNFFGCGARTRANTELCLIATKGKIERIDATISQLIEEPIGLHSEKPNIVRKKIVQLVGDLPRIELFSRQKEEYWDCWGNEIIN